MAEISIIKQPSPEHVLHTAAVICFCSVSQKNLYHSQMITTKWNACTWQIFLLNKKKYKINKENFKIIYILIDFLFLNLGNIIYKVVYITTTCQT